MIRTLQISSAALIFALEILINRSWNLKKFACGGLLTHLVILCHCLLTTMHLYSRRRHKLRGDLLFNVEIVILSEHNKRRNCYPVEIVTLPRTQKVEIVNLLKLQRIFYRARCARPLKLYNIEIVVL